jgi:hypothetical protein
MAGLLSLVALGSLVGCGGNSTVRVSGKVTFQGKPVPAGKIYFMADGSKGNNGATGFATIVDGEYDTSAEDGSGVTPGPVKVMIDGFDPTAPPEKPKKGGKNEDAEQPTVKLLFSQYETTFDVPSGGSTKDFDVPAAAAKGPKEPGKPAGFIQP